MTFLFGCEKVHLEYPTKVIFDNLSLGVDAGDCIGVVGRNGDGKSSLLGLFSGSVEPDEGRVLRSRGVRFAHLQQKDQLDDAKSVAENIVGDIPEYEWASDARIRSILDGLVSDLDWHETVENLSGGERRRVDLARVLVADADVVLLDEPTNHLDIGGIAWLADHLKKRFSRGVGALIVVTHDRWFLDEICLRMWEVHDGGVTPFEGGYSAYILQRVERERQIQLAEQKRQNLMRRELAWLSRGARARSTKPKFHVEAARALIAEEPPLRNSIELKRAAMSRLGKQCITLENITFAYDEKRVIDDATWLIGPGDRFGLLGENGAGKSTLLDVIRGTLHPQTGTVKIGKTVKIAFLSQKLEELDEFADDYVRVVLGHYQSHYVIDGKTVSPAQLMEDLGFDSRYLKTQVKALSGGQKRRLQLMLILLDAPNVLILDEPSNDLDTDMLVAMENVLDTWPGTLILVTHDRALMERVTDHQYALIDGKIRHVPRGVDEYLELLGSARTGDASASRQGNARNQRGTSAQNDASVQSDAHAQGGANAQGGAGTPVSGLSGGEVHELRKQLNSIERKMNTLEKKIAQARQKQLEIDPSNYIELGEVQKEIQALQDDMDALEETWLELSERLS